MDVSVMPLRQRIATNIRHLLRVEDQTPPQAAARAGIDPKSINNLLHARFDPRLTQVEKVARAFRLHAWQLLAFDMSSAVPDQRELLRLVEIYAELDASKRQALLGVADAMRSKK